MCSCTFCYVVNAFYQKIVRNFEVISKVDIGSDHRMVRVRVEIDKKLMRLKRIQKQNPYR